MLCDSTTGLPPVLFHARQSGCLAAGRKKPQVISEAWGFFCSSGWLV